MLAKAKTIYAEFPHTFWVLVSSTFIDRLGGSLLFPFFALYVTIKFNVGMTEVGTLFAIFAGSGIAGGVLGGAMTDKFGRRWMIIFSLVVSALSSLAMGLVTDLKVFYILAAFVGFLGDTGGPAQQAMVADILPEKKQAEGYGIIRVAFNVAVTVGPAIGGLLAAKSFMLLFIIDAVTSLITALIVYFTLPETKPQPTADYVEQSMLQTIGGYGKVFQDRAYMIFLLATLLSCIVYMQMNTTLSVYLNTVHGLPPVGYGYILSLNAAMVVLFQFWVTRRISAYSPMVMVALGTMLYAVGFAMYGFVSGMALFMLAMVVITIGEMIVSPVMQAVVARFAPPNMRGRYMAMFGFSWGLSFGIGPLMAGVVMDNFNPNLVWFGGGIIATLSALVYLGLRAAVGNRLQSTLVDEELPVNAPIYSHATDAV